MTAGRVSAALQYVIGLVVDDAFVAALALVWVAIGLIVVPRIVLDPAARGLILFAGLALVLVAGSVRRAARHRRR